jgi:hypothetical protein
MQPIQRETATFTTPSGDSVVIKTYLTGREKRDITNASLPKSINYSAASEGEAQLDLAEITNRGEDAVIKNIVVSINGKTETEIDFVSAILDMRSEDADAVLQKIKEVADGLTTEKKTT